MSNFFLSFLFLFLLWSGLVFPLSGQEAIFGTALCLIISFIISIYGRNAKKFKIQGIYHLFMFAIIFIWELIKANLNIAKIVLTPSLPISPRIVEMKTSIKSKLGRAFLANSITLTPGTLSVDIDEDTYYIHVVDGDALDDPDSIKGPFEKHLKGAFD